MKEYSLDERNENIDYVKYCKINVKHDDNFFFRNYLIRLYISYYLADFRLWPITYCMCILFVYVCNKFIIKNFINDKND